MHGPEPIRIITTGGTIDKVYFDAKSEFEVGEPLIGAILHEAQVGFEFEVLPLMRKDSLEITAADRALIRDAASAAPESRIIITHGTDYHGRDRAVAHETLPAKRSFWWARSIRRASDLPMRSSISAWRWPRCRPWTGRRLCHDERAHFRRR